jgi:hypothetical protein
MEREPGPLSASELADLAGVTEAEVARMVGVGVLLPREGARPFRTTDVQKVRLAEACERAGLPKPRLRPPPGLDASTTVA